MSALLLACVGPRTPAPPAFVVPTVPCRASDALCLRLRNEIDSDFRVTSATFVLDGAELWRQGVADDGTSVLLTPGESIVVWSGPVTQGEHTLQAVVGLQGSGYGVYSYIRSYKFDVKASHRFTARPKEHFELATVSFFKGGSDLPIEQRPDVKFEERGVPIASPSLTSGD